MEADEGQLTSAAPLLQVEPTQARDRWCIRKSPDK